MIGRGLPLPNHQTAERRGVVIPIAERLERHSIPEPNSGCVLWIGSILPSGYGRFLSWNPTTKKGTNTTAHRIAYQSARGIELAPDIEVDHRCRVRSCINPKHLRAVTHAENQERLRGQTYRPRRRRSA